MVPVSQSVAVESRSDGSLLLEEGSTDDDGEEGRRIRLQYILNCTLYSPRYRT